MATETTKIEQQKEKVIMSEQENNSPRQAAVNALISWAKTGWGYYSIANVAGNNFSRCLPLYFAEFIIGTINPLTIGVYAENQWAIYPVIN